MKAYLELTKPGIIMGNTITAIGGFGLAGPFEAHLFWTLLGLAGIVGSACVFNNIIDCKADGKMERTKNRPLPKKTLSVPKAAFFGLVLGLCGILCLLYTPKITLLLALLGFCIYVFLYSFAKYVTPRATLIGSIAGAIPPLVGYTASMGTLDTTAALLFASVALWQMPHFFSIAAYRQSDYKVAGIPIYPFNRRLKIQMLFYVITFTLILIYFGWIFALLGIVWSLLALVGFGTRNNQRWARTMFFYSLVAISLFSFGIIRTDIFGRSSQERSQWLKQVALVE